MPDTYPDTSTALNTLALSPLVTAPGNAPIYTIQMLGLPARERTLFGSIFNLSLGRRTRYFEFDPAQHPHVDFYIVDAEDEQALERFVKIDPASYGGALLIGKPQMNSDHPVINRPIRWADVLMRLDALPRPSYPAQVAALVSAGLVAPQQVPSGVPPPPIPEEPPAVTSTQFLRRAELHGITATQPDVRGPSRSPNPTATLLPGDRIRVAEAENLLELSQVASWYERDQIITFKTDPAVLVIDADIASRRYMAAKLIDLRYRVDYAESGEQALAMYDQHRYNVVFMDVALPGIDGYEVCRLIKGHEDRRRSAVVFVTNKHSTFDRVRGAVAGCDAFLTKPLDQEKLSATLDKFLPNWRMQLPIV